MFGEASILRIPTSREGKSEYLGWDALNIWGRGPGEGGGTSSWEISVSDKHLKLISLRRKSRPLKPCFLYPPGSAFRSTWCKHCHPPVSALTPMGTTDCAVLVLLDLIQCSVHWITTFERDRLQCRVGVGGTTVICFTSHLSSSFSFRVCSFSSPQASLSCGVPHGTVLSPIVFSIYMLPLGWIILQKNITFHVYTDDTQLSSQFNVLS